METRPTIYAPMPNPQIYSGVSTYLGLPAAKDKEDLKNYDFAVLGVPWEGGCTIGGFSSCELAPKAIRETSVRYTGYLPEWDISNESTDIYVQISEIDDSETKTYTRLFQQPKVKFSGKRI